jgi:hypothetical protein
LQLNLFPNEDKSRITGSARERRRTRIGNDQQVSTNQNPILKAGPLRSCLLRSMKPTFIIGPGEIGRAYKDRGYWPIGILKKKVLPLPIWDLNPIFP